MSTIVNKPVEKRKLQAKSSDKNKASKKVDSKQHEPYLTRICVTMIDDCGLNYNVHLNVLLESGEWESDVHHEFDVATDEIERMINQAYPNLDFSKESIECSAQPVPPLNQDARIHLIVDKQGELVDRLGEYKTVDFDCMFDASVYCYQAYMAARRKKGQEMDQGEHEPDGLEEPDTEQSESDEPNGLEKQSDQESENEQSDDEEENNELDETGSLVY